MTNQVVDSNFTYTGNQELQQAKFMPNYNSHIASLFGKKIIKDHKVLDFGAGIGNISKCVRAKKLTRCI